jgi:SpoVK/Ycf46/Vps4 family AAA+-type ATPase
MDTTLTLHTNDDFYDYVLYYMCSEKTIAKNIKNFTYISESNLKPYEYVPRYRRSELEKENKVKICSFDDTSFNFTFEGKNINVNLETYMDNGKPLLIQMVTENCCGTNEEVIFKKLTLTSDNKDILIKFVDLAKTFCEDQMSECKKSSNKSIKIYYWRKDYWNLLFKSPKRPIETLYLKEGQKKKLLDKVEGFYSKETRADYISFGIPYKCVFLLHGVPGSGKTSTINTIASHFDCDIYTIPISKELTDYMLIDAISSCNSVEKEDRKKIIVIEDIDTIFTDRKTGDDMNNISLQGLLNCLDGFSCAEGTILFITANNPEIFDSAFLRSCRIDYRFELDYADEYQTKAIFETVLPAQKENYRKFYNFIKTKKYTTAMLQEFLFFNRKEKNILDLMDEFYLIIEKNDPKNFEKEKEEKQNIYM